MKVLVTGASGFLGSHIAETLAAQGHDLRLLLRRESSRRFLKGLPYEEAEGDVCRPDSLLPAVKDIDVVVHAAGLIKARSEAEFARVNAGGTANLLAAASAAAPDLKRFVYVSSLAAQGPSADGRPRSPDAPPQPITAYGRTKLAGEEATRASFLASRSVIFRPPVIYGPRDPALLPFFKLVRWGLAPLLADDRNRISIVYGQDAASAIAAAAVAEADVAGKTYTLDDGSVYSWQEMLAAVEEALGRRALKLHAPVWSFQAAAAACEAFALVTRRPVSLTREKVREMAQRHWVCSHEELSRDLGWTPQVDLREGARWTAAWYRAQGWL
jgi:nucleoside-diphosphate-sugar epimerase